LLTMCFYRENQLFAKRNFNRLAQIEKPTPQEGSTPQKQVDKDLIIEDQLNKKKKMLDLKAPGLFDHLVKLTQEEDSTEASSDLTSESPIEENTEIQTSADTNAVFIEDGSSDLSEVLRPQPFTGDSELLPLPDMTLFKMNKLPTSDSFEHVQRQRILALMEENTLMLNNIIASQDNFGKKIKTSLQELVSFKVELGEGSKSQIEKIEQIKEQKKSSGQFDSNPTANNLFKHFFNGPHLYRYELVLDSEIPSPIFRERNLIVKVKLMDTLTGKPAANLNKLVLHLSLHTWEVPSSPILRNKSGNRAIMGDTEVELQNGEGFFDRIQINEVTSKFIHGHVAVLIVPANPSNAGTSLSECTSGENYINFENIKPLMLEKVVVKSKKKNPKKRDE